jgi:hypothetical protein
MALATAAALTGVALAMQKIVDIKLADAQSDDCNSTANDKEG